MKEAEVRIVNRLGIHARPSAALTQLAGKQGSNGKISAEDLKDIMRITLSDPIVLKLMGNKDFNDPKELNKFKEHIYKNSDWAELHRKEYPEIWKI